MRKGDLRRDYDVILVPNQGRGSAHSLVFDVQRRGKPLAYTKTERFPNHGMYGESEDITGGMGLEGAAELKRSPSRAACSSPLGHRASSPPSSAWPARGRGPPFGPVLRPGPIVEAEILRPEHPIF